MRNPSTACYPVFGFWVEISPDNATAEIFEYDGEGRASDEPVHSIIGMTFDGSPDQSTTYLQARAWARAERVRRDNADGLTDDGADTERTVEPDQPQEIPGIAALPGADSGQIGGQFEGQELTGTAIEADDPAKAPSVAAVASPEIPSPTPDPAAAAPAKRTRGRTKGK